MASYLPSDTYYHQFTTANPNTGAAQNADSLPTATANHNGVDDSSFVLTVTNVATGVYMITGTIPSGYAKGDVINIRVAATVAGTSGEGPIDTQVLDSLRVGDLHNAPVLADYQQRMVPVTLPANPPSGFIATASFAAGATLPHVTLADTVTTVTNPVAITSNVKKNQALNPFSFVMTDSTSHAPKTGLTVTAVRSLDGAAFAACAHAPTELNSGVYLINLASSDTNCNTLTLLFTATGADNLVVTIQTQP